MISCQGAWRFMQYSFLHLLAHLSAQRQGEVFEHHPTFCYALKRHQKPHGNQGATIFYYSCYCIMDQQKLSNCAKWSRVFSSYGWEEYPDKLLSSPLLEKDLRVTPTHAFHVLLVFKGKILTTRYRLFVCRKVFNLSKLGNSSALQPMKAPQAWDCTS